MRVRYQGGSLAGFIIIGVILSLLLVGSLYGLNRYNAEQSKDLASGQKSGSGEKKPTNPTDSESKEAPAPTKPQPTDKESSSSTGAKPEPTDQGSSSDSPLPATGPTDTIAAAIGAVALSIAVAYYAQSFSYKRR